VIYGCLLGLGPESFVGFLIELSRGFDLDSEITIFLTLPQVALFF
jgi:hypothetical protein